MRDQKLYESVGKYIDKYYIDKPDDIKLCNLLEYLTQ